MGSDLVVVQRIHDSLEGGTLAVVEQRLVLLNVRVQVAGVEKEEFAEGAVGRLAGACRRLGEPEALQRMALIVPRHVLLQLKQGSVLVRLPALPGLRWGRQARADARFVAVAREGTGAGRAHHAWRVLRRVGPVHQALAVLVPQGFGVGNLAHAEQRGEKQPQAGPRLPDGCLGERGIPFPVVLEQAELKASLEGSQGGGSVSLRREKGRSAAL